MRLYVLNLTIQVSHLIFIKSEVYIFPLGVLFFRGCVSKVSEMFVPFCAVCCRFHIIRNSWVLLRLLLCSPMMGANNRIHHGLSNKHHLRLSLSYLPWNIWGCVYYADLYLMLIVRIHVLYRIIIITSKVWPICNCLGLVYETMVCTLCRSIFL